MIKSNNFTKLRSRSTIVYSKGQLLEDYKLYGDKRRKYYAEEQVYENERYNQVQNFLYKRALYGLNLYNKREIRELKPYEKHQIQKVTNRTNKLLNVWKQKLIIKRSNELFELFPNSPLAQDLIKNKRVDPKLRNKFTFGDLSMRKEDVIDKLLEAGILPKNFYNINNENKIKAL
jgi:hypothetical protein